MKSGGVAVIGGTGLAALDAEALLVADSARTPFGSASCAPRRGGRFPGVLFMNRHGAGRALLPHEINYRANLWLLHQLGVRTVVAVFAVGGISRDLADGRFVLPRQLIDYTFGRAHTFAGADGATHADFSDPFDAALRGALAGAASRAGVVCVDDGVYGCTQGPRLETAAEINRMERDGCTVVGMTAMPEAGLARGLGMAYAGICLVVNPAAGRGPAVIEVADMLAVVDAAQPRLLGILEEFLPRGR